MTTKMTRAGAIALGDITLAPMTSAGEWRLNPDRCQDIREEWRPCGETLAGVTVEKTVATIA